MTNNMFSYNMIHGGIDYPIGSMYGIFTYIWWISMVNVGKYTIHGYYGYGLQLLCVLKKNHDKCHRRNMEKKW